MKLPKSLKSKLILYFLIVTIVPSIAISFFYYKNSKSTLETSMISNAENNIAYIMGNVEKQLKDVEKLSDWIFYNRVIERILMRDYSGHTSIYDSDIKTFQEVVDGQMLSSPVGKYISSLLIIANNGVDLRSGQDAFMIEKEAIKNLPWFKQGIDMGGRIYWNTIVENPSRIKTDEYIIPLVRPIVSTVSDAHIGWSMIGFKETLIGDVLKKFNIGEDDSLLIIDSNGRCIVDKDGKYVGKDLVNYGYIQKALEGSDGHFTAEIEGKKRLVVFHQSRLTGWRILEILSYNDLNAQNKILANVTMIVLALSIMVSSIFTVFLSFNLTKPLKRLLKRVNDISKGDFERDISLERDDEMGILGSGINEMAVNINELLKRLLDEEREKRKLELKVLQNQVNPHFLYNTLNSIKWMATVQKADGIRDMVSALGRLLRDIARGTSEKVPLREELSLLEDYVYIQRVRYKGKIKVLYEVDEALLDYKIIKFTLQPLVENAIFHGIEPKRDAGRIVISASIDGIDMVLCVEDDGMGMSEEQISALFSDNGKEEDNNRGLSGIGVKNVNERIKLTYGKEYGLRIESEETKYTKVFIRIPLEK